MSKDELISKQAMKIYKQKKLIKDYTTRLRCIHNTIYCIGGPLNDNKLGYTKEQMKDFYKIAELAKGE